MGVNIPDEGVGPLIEVIIGAFQQIAGAKPTHILVNPAPINRVLPLECIQTLGVKEFTGVKGINPTVAEYLLEGVKRIIDQMSCFIEEKLLYCVFTRR
ncbi:hypothetical protein PVK06_040041 [Gossypium arboreum]|uniref:Uncharacterized protein n=1 Tax=Gossypium arboreum TaxID=29729 RepID=A0ABR0N4G0_GOSAR|nr:hypothetical protein PVK06_040041 [Gossypium arboreum]